MDSEVDAKKAQDLLEDPSIVQENLEDDLDDDFMQNLREKRFEEMKKQMAQMQEMKNHSHGSYSEITEEKDFLSTTTSTEKVICHFYHKDFQRCRIMDKHLAALSQKHFKTRFVKISVEKAPFFVDKLQIRVLPAVICFQKGVVIDRIIGFSDLGEQDDFSTALLEKRLSLSGILEVKNKFDFGNSTVRATADEDSDDD